MPAKRIRKNPEPPAPSKPGTAIFAIRHAVGPAEAMIRAERRNRALVKKSAAERATGHAKKAQKRNAPKRKR